MTPEQRADEAIKIISRFMKPELTSLFRQVEAAALEEAARAAEEISEQIEGGLHGYWSDEETCGANSALELAAARARSVKDEAEIKRAWSCCDELRAERDKAQSAYEEEIEYLRSELEYHLKQRNLWTGDIVGKKWGKPEAEEPYPTEFFTKNEI